MAKTQHSIVQDMTLNFERPKAFGRRKSQWFVALSTMFGTKSRHTSRLIALISCAIPDIGALQTAIGE
jgi:hypothetical protein